MLAGVSSPICLFGAGGHGRGIAAQVARVTGRMPIFADESLPIGTAVAGTTVSFVKLDDIGAHPLIVTVGSAAHRRAIQERAYKHGLTVTHFIADVDRFFGNPPGRGSVVLSGAVVNAETQIAEGVIINNGAIVEHGCKIGDYCHIAPGAVIAGDVEIDSDVWVGANATVLQGLRICAHVTIGAGAVVTKSISRPGVYVGQPARRMEPTVI
ncbi:NeuD/PglB/VioB family sugar acetyltransferase [Fuscovulum ytuae]|uniref:NeuD/PglB/VioB family sugar acetyltransferase n=1 Tax=Fuscovulum ytuae TaxID=3042299 RepID=A0ABY8Q5G8_9RHOB|nr:NeuD/PglB/VioB family sugar acetyltransferase [Fuscovulum sp. YMD61]WGV15422.1 NeuD/PglB/VioB family sugar acetyltransferase [Fuscovulum sp. YMD61]